MLASKNGTYTKEDGVWGEVGREYTTFTGIDGRLGLLTFQILDLQAKHDHSLNFHFPLWK